MSAAVDLAPIVAGSAVLIHCTLGVNRAATITIGIVVQRLGITVPAAVALVKSKRDVIDPNPLYRRQLADRWPTVP